jgi:hypothetical protein
LKEEEKVKENSNEENEVEKIKNKKQSEQR